MEVSGPRTGGGAESRHPIYPEADLDPGHGPQLEPPHRLADPDTFYGFPGVLSATQSHCFMETEAALAFAPHSNCGGDRPLLPRVTPPKADTSEQLSSEARPRLLPVK